MVKKAWLLALVCFVLPVRLISDQQQNPPSAIQKGAHYRVFPAPFKIKVDGVLDEEAWSKAEVIKLPYEWTPGDNTPAPVETECRVTFDTSYLYISFKCFDPEPDKIRAHLMDRDNTDSLIQDDHISIMIDSFNDERRGFQFRVNPLGIQADANFSELEGYEDFSWDAIWASAGKITDLGYTIEMAIPFNQLRFPKSVREQTWGFSAERSWPRNVRYRMTSHIRSRNVACILCQFNKITGLKNISPGNNIEFDPTLTANRTDTMPMESFPAGVLEKGKVNAEPGLTVKWGITPNLILNATANPDFSQIEADVAQLDVNKRFALYYPEKRPFFLEAADFFLTPFEAVFTRTVADPLWGTKLTGKIGRSAMGFFAGQDRINNLIFPSNQGSLSASLNEDVYGGVFRFRYDIGKASTLGILYTGRAGENYYNHVGGVDGFFRLDEKNSIRFQYLRSKTDYPEDLALDYGQRTSAFSGNAIQAEYNHLSRSWMINARYRTICPNFRADYGFIPRVDIHEGQATIFRLFWGKPKGWFDRIMLGFQGQLTTNSQGQRTDQLMLLSFGYQGPLQTLFQIFGGAKKEFFNGVMYDQWTSAAQLTIKPFGGFSSGFMGQFGDAIDYSNLRAAKILSVGPNVDFRLGRHLNLLILHNLEHLSRDGRKIYTANLTQAKIIYNFNVRCFVRAILQYRNVDRDPARYLSPVFQKEDGLFTQFLFSYKLNPQTVLFLGYSDNSSGFQTIDLTRTDRTYFFKIGYALGL